PSTTNKLTGVRLHLAQRVTFQTIEMRVHVGNFALSFFQSYTPEPNQPWIKTDHTEPPPPFAIPIRRQPIAEKRGFEWSAATPSRTLKTVDMLLAMRKRFNIGVGSLPT